MIPDLEVELEEETGMWTKGHASWKRSLWRSPLLLTILHSQDYYMGERWPAQRIGMQAYVQRFPGAEDRPEVLEYLGGLRFALHFKLDPMPVRGDPRLQLIRELAAELKAIVFSPHGLTDGQGRAILSENGDRDPLAEVPAHTPSAAWGALDGRPSPMRVAQRLLVMAALTERGLLDVSEEDTVMREDRRDELVQLLKEINAWGEATHDEQKTLQVAIGALDEAHAWNMSWLAEGVLVLAWALGRSELPPYDEEADLGLLWQLAGLTKGGASAARLVSMAQLRPEEEIRSGSDQILAIHWRLRKFEQDGQPRDLAAFAAKAWTGALDLGMARVVDGDLAIDDVALADCEESRREVVAAIVAERHKMMRWLMGHSA
jgi:hypothetical protein